jgi:hypothetical protein
VGKGIINNFVEINSKKLFPQKFNFLSKKKKKLNLAWQCVPAFPSDNEKHKNRKIVSKPDWAKHARSYFKNNQRVKCWRYSSSDLPSKCKNREFKPQYAEPLL